ncbi:YicC/YloC family endoribonuclease [Alteribacter keqinensis]|uniref:YicC family protein n=1 Tax=Alteribacter keqinensis TaxID=2483800 RepID=A0A3M7TVZ8_9BACI|nr:YicC/YloC family endoribonuclease [Alteribacter keqinensis]RNA69653.1 YicC family protein [Alteribacter keqinensis]
MIVSMTGYGRSVEQSDSFHVTVEMKSVNHRFCEVNVRMPRQFLMMEDRVKKTIGRFVKRGKVDVFITVGGENFIKRDLSVDWNLLEQYVHTFEKMQKTYNTSKQAFPFSQMLTHEDVVSVDEADDVTEEVQTLLYTAVERAAKQLHEMRQAEGKELYRDLTNRSSLMGEWAAQLKQYAPAVHKRYQERLEKRVSDFLEGKFEADEARILTEVAVFSDKSDIQEELTRIDSHLKQFDAILESGGVVGRKLDFLVQELNREFNTIGSKANDIQISQRVVELKSELEKVREQVQNIE